MKKHEILFWAIKLPLDFLIVFFSFFLARSIRLITDLIPGVHLPIQTIETSRLINFALFWAILFMFIFIFSWLYKIKISKKFKEFFDIIKASFIWFIFFIAIIYLANGYPYNTEIPRLIIFFALFISIFFIIIERFLIDKMFEFLLKKWFIDKNKIIVIIKSNEQRIINEISKPFYYKVLWYVNKEENKNINLKYLGNFDDLKKNIKKWNISEIFYVNSDFSQLELEEIFEYSRIYWVRYKYLANSFDLVKNNTETSFLGQIPIVEIKSIWLSPWGRIIKRIFDIFASFIWLIILLPFFLIIWMLIKIEDPDGPAIYKNKRVWKNWKLFDLYKFRYFKWIYCIKDSYGIKPEEDKALEFEKELIKERSKRVWPLYKIKDDPRKTRIWALIERFSIDELPQLFNVLIWNMSLVWPRPHQPREVDLYKEYQKRVLTIKPWITWMAQVNWRDDNEFDDEVRLDIFYIENWSLLLDFKIILKTVWAVVMR